MPTHKNLYIKAAMIFWTVGFVILALSKPRFVYLDTLSLWGNTLSDLLYYFGDHVGRILMMLGTLSCVFALESIIPRSRYVVYSKFMLECYTGIMVVRAFGELFTYSIITRYEYFVHVGVVLVAIVRIILYYRTLKQNQRWKSTLTK